MLALELETRKLILLTLNTHTHTHKHTYTHTHQKIPDKIQNIHKCNRLQKQPAFSNKLEERH